MKIIRIILNLFGMTIKGAIAPASAPRLRELLLCTFVVTSIGFVVLLAERNKRAPVSA